MVTEVGLCLEGLAEVRALSPEPDFLRGLDGEAWVEGGAEAIRIA